MRIDENVRVQAESYSDDIRKRVSEAFIYALHIAELKSLLTEIKKGCMGLYELFFSEQEQNEINRAVGFFDARMQAMVFYTLKNLEEYERYGWTSLVDEGENTHGNANSI